MQIDKYSSLKINILSILAIVMVVFIHSTYLEADSYPIARSVQRVCGTTGLSCVATSLFFLISGFFFFKGMMRVKDCFPRIKKRLKTLLIPYVLWNCIFVLWYVVLSIIPGISGFVNSNIIEQYIDGTILNDLKMLLWEPASFPLWILRDLIIMVLLSPVIYTLIRYLKWGAPILFVFPFIEHHISPFFILGGCIALYSNLDDVTNSLKKTFVIISSIVYLSISFAQIWIDSYFYSLKMISAFCGIVTLWKLYDYIANKEWIISKMKIFKPMLGYSFFIYVFHEPTFNIIKKISLRLLGIHEWSLILLYIINPFIMCTLAVCIAKILQMYVPRIYAVLVGNR